MTPTARVVLVCPACGEALRVEHLPVFAERRLCGVVSIGDIVKLLASDRKMQIEQLTSYIQGVPGVATA